MCIDCCHMLLPCTFITFHCKKEVWYYAGFNHICTKMVFLHIQIYRVSLSFIYSTLFYISNTKVVTKTNILPI